MESSETQQLEDKQVARRVCGTSVRKGKRSLLACQTRCKCSMETTRYSVEVKLDVMAMKLVESLIVREVTVIGQR